MKCAGYEEETTAHIVRLIGRLHSDLLHKEKLITAGIKLDIQ